MNNDLGFEEQEQLEQFKTFWKRYGNLILSVLFAAAATATALQWMHHNTVRKATEAASLYATLQGIQQAGQPQAVAALADTLIQRYPDSAYAARGALIAAASNATAHQPAAARKELQWVLDHSKESALRSIAALRLAGMLLDEHQPDSALKLLDAPHDEQDAALYSDMQGDGWVMLNQRQQARTAYRIALEKLPAGSPYRQVVEIKLNAIAGVAPK